jgi:FkbM family methyltransferase
MSELYEHRWSEQATLDDIYYCYRLLLGREPGEEGWKYWGQRIADEQFTYSKLAAHFRQSREYISGARARGIKRVALDGFDLYVYEHDWDIGEHIIQTGQYEPQVTAFLRRHLQTGMTFIDVGANIGYFTLLAATLVGTSGKTIAVECNPKNCELIYMSLHRNGFDNVLVYPFALSDTRKLMRFTSGFSNGVVNELAEEDEESVIVPAVTLDSLVQNEPRIDIIKMDIEGSEAKAWQGMQQIVDKHRPTILMEFFPDLLGKISEVKAEEFLNKIFASGYTASVLRPAPHESLEAASPAEVMEAWRKQCEAVGDESKAYLDLALFSRPKG